MTDTGSEPATEDGPLGLLIVHGVGNQQPGDMLQNFAAGLKRIAPEMDNQDIVDGSSVLIGGRTVRLYEVYWADLLEGENARRSFLLDEFTALSWFPWFNFRRGCYGGGRYSLWQLIPTFVLLPIASMLFFVAYHGARLLATTFDTLRSPQQRDRTAGFLEQVRQNRQQARDLYSTVDKVLDDYAGDVLTYANSTGGAFYRRGEESQPTDGMRAAHQSIMARFDQAVARAGNDGCASLQIVAHSLGSVIAYHYLAKPEVTGHVADNVEHLYTIGSPLEKFDLFWPWIMLGAEGARERTCKWDNFVSFFDPIAGVLQRFDHWGGVVNHRLLGGGFLRGHIVYQHSAVFLNHLSRGICGSVLPIARSGRERVVDALLLLGETLSTPLLLILVLGAGFMLLTIVALLLPFLASLLVRFWLDDAVWVPVYDWAGLAFGCMFAFIFALTPLLRAGAAQREGRQSEEEVLGSAD